MVKLKIFININLAINILTILGLLYYWLIILRRPLGVIVLTLILLLFTNIALCLFSAIGIKYGYTNLVSRLWISIFSLVLFYILLDSIGGFIFFPHNKLHDVPDEYVHHKYAPNKVMRSIVAGDFDLYVSTDSMGFRKQNSIGKKDPSTVRIVMLGDSFTAGMQVKEDQTFSYLLEKYLNESSRQRYEVVNHGRNSYAPILEYLQLKVDLEKLKPDVVIMNFDMSDVVQEYVYRKEAKFDNDGDPENVDGFKNFALLHEPLNRRIRDWVYRNLFITTALMELLNKHFEKQVSMENLDIESAVMRSNRTLLLHTLKDSNFNFFNEYMSLVEDSIFRAKKLCDKYGVKFILTTYPWGHQVNDKEWVPGRYTFLPKKFALSDRTVEELQRFSDKNSITFMNAFPWFREYKGSNLLYNNHDMHWTSTGHNRMAVFLAKKLKAILQH